MSKDKIPKQAGIDELIVLGKNALNCSGVHASRNEKGISHLNTIAAVKVNKKYVLLLAASLSATALFIAAFNIPRLIANANHIKDYDTGQIFQDIRGSTITLPFILLNSAVFVVSLAIVISILRSFPMKPWPQITVSMFFYLLYVLEHENITMGIHACARVFHPITTIHSCWKAVQLRRVKTFAVLLL